MGVETIFDVPNRAITVRLEVELSNRTFIVPPIALLHGKWSVTWHSPLGYPFADIQLTSDNWPPLLKVESSGIDPLDDHRWTASFDNRCLEANAATYTIYAHDPNGDPVSGKDPTIVVTKDPIDTVNS